MLNEAKHQAYHRKYRVGDDLNHQTRFAVAAEFHIHDTAFAHEPLGNRFRAKAPGSHVSWVSASSLRGVALPNVVVSEAWGTTLSRS